MLYLKVSWLNSSPEEIRFGEIYRTELKRVGIALNEKGDAMFAIAEWSQWPQKVMSAIEAAVETYRSQWP